MSANKEAATELPSTSKQDSGKTKDVFSVVLFSKGKKELPELKVKSGTIDQSKPLSQPLRKDFVPEEILVALTSAANPVPCPTLVRPPKKTKRIKDFQGCIRPTEGVWQHAGRRTKFQYLIQHPISLTGAGRDISFLFDIKAENETKNVQTLKEQMTLPGKSTEQKEDTAVAPTNIANSLVPEEFHIIKNRGVMGLEYYDDKYTTLLEDHENRLRVFPSMKPSGRLEVLQLMKVMDSMLEKAGVADEDVGVSGLSQVHRILELLKVEQNVYNIVFHEIIRQVSVGCAERGELLSKLRQRYVELLQRIPKQLSNLHKEMMAQRVMDKHITEELFKFKEAVEKLTRELHAIREHDRITTFEAEMTYEELARAVHETEMNANLLDEYRELYELQRKRLEAQIHQLTREKELWSTAAYDLALKVIEKNKLILARRMYNSEKGWTKAMRHFILLLVSEDSSDLSKLQEQTQEFRELLKNIGIEVKEVEETCRGNLKSIQNGLTGWLNYFNDIFARGSYNFTKGATLLDQILVDLKVWEKMLNEELEQCGGEVHLRRLEPLKVAADLQKHWVELGIAVHSRHKDLNGHMPPELKVLMKINKNSNQLCQQYHMRLSGENGYARVLIGLVNNFEDWTFKLLASKEGPGLHEADWIKFFHTVSEWLTQLDDLLQFIGSIDTPEDRRLKIVNIPVEPENLFKKIQQWILTTTSGAEKENVQLSEELTDLHNELNKWMVKLLIHMVPDHITHESLPLTDAEAARQAEQKLLDIFALEGEAMGLAAKLSKFSNYLVSCCKEMVASITRKKMFHLDADPEYELQQLERVKTECLDWINTCNLLLSGMKSSPTNLINTDELINMFGAEVVQARRELPPHPEDYIFQTVEAPEESKRDDEDGAKKTVKTKHVEEEKVEKKMEKKEQRPSLRISSVTAMSTIAQEVAKAEIRYIGEDSNVHMKPLEMEQVTVSGREMYVSQWATKFSGREFEMLASLEILEERLLEAEKRAQEAEKKSESLHEQLEEALSKIQDLEGEASSPPSRSPVDELPKREAVEHHPKTKSTTSTRLSPTKASLRKKSKPKR